MAFKAAIDFAKTVSPEINRAWDRVQKSAAAKIKTPCYLFSVDGIVYYFGFDGVDMHTGQMNAKRSMRLIECSEVTIIL